MEEYVVTLKSGEDLEEFYNDMETPGGNLYIPDREVDVALRRPISRNTHYMLFPEEVETIKNDPRVWDVISKKELDSRVRTPEYTQTGRFDKDTGITQLDKNWALLRCVNGEQILNWGDDGTSNQNETITVTSSGLNVDVVIMDGHIDPNHPEYAVNPDGTGGSRVVQYNWYQLTSLATGGSNGTYVYPSGDDLKNDEDNHGAHVAGTACGNTQGWARGASIYNISPYSNNPNAEASIYPFDYVRVWHQNKPINPKTGLKNPTIVNMSFGSSNSVTRSSISKITYQGTDYTSFTDEDLDSYGFAQYTSTEVFFPASQYTGDTADIQDMISEGIIIVGSAGNTSYKITRSGDIDYDNSITYGINSTVRYYHRGDFRYGSDIICTGAIAAFTIDVKGYFSNTGSRIDVFAPGVHIISSVHNNVNSVDDERNTSYKLAKKFGTSMASPQVTGVLACLLEQYPRFNQSQVINYLNKFSKYDQLYDTGGSYDDVYSLQGAPNRYLYFNKERLESGVTIPKSNFSFRQTSGSVWPRRKFI